MPPAFEPDDHYILHKLGNELLPWMAGGKLITHHWLIYLAVAYSYGAEITTAVGGLGIGSSITPLLQGKAPPGTNVLDSWRGPSFWLGAVALAVWFLVRIIVGIEDGVAPKLLAQDCARTMQKLQKDLDGVLREANPLPHIAPIQDAVMRKVGDAIDKGIWRWDPPFPATRQIDLEVGIRIADFRRRFMHYWRPAPAGDI